MCGLLANVSHSLPQDLSGRFRATISGSSVSGFGPEAACGSCSFLSSFKAYAAAGETSRAMRLALLISATRRS
jgi:hypothetical protein